MAFSSGFSTPRSPFANAAPLAHRPLSAIAATIAGGVAQRRIQRILTELIPVLEALHQKGRICGDISVHSVGFDEAGQAHLMALAFHAAPADRLQALTSGYAPFELYTESSDWPLGPWTDLYGLSAVVYSLVAGQSPPAATERAIYDDYRPLIGLGLTKYTDEFLQGIDAGLALRPVDRPQTMQAYAESLGLTAFAPIDGSAPETVDLPVLRLAVKDGSTRRHSVRRTIRIVLLGIATLGVAVYWSGRLAGESQQVIVHSEPAAISLDVAGIARFFSIPAVDLSPAAVDSSERANADDVNESVLRTPELDTPSIRQKPPAQREVGASAILKKSAPPTTAAIKADRKALIPVKVGINVRPWGEIVIDGVSRGVTPPLKTVMLRPGKYTVTIRNNAREPYNTTLVVTADKPAVITHAFR